MRTALAAKDSDKMLLHAGKETFAVEANIVAEVVEAERFFMLPFAASSPAYSKKKFIKGVITQRDEVIVVVDLNLLLNLYPAQSNEEFDEGPFRVAITKQDASCLGIYWGAKGLSFLWKEGLKNLEFKPSDENYITGVIDPSNKKLRLLDWQRILEETQKLLSCR